jgi:hypothetical protein
MDNMDFDAKLKRALGVVKEDRRPKLGIWYYLWLAPKWKLRTYTYTEDSKNLAHLEAWRAILPDIAEHYGITDRSKIDALEDAYTCMPRGRVDSNVGLGISDTLEWYGVFHGNDFPLPMSAEIKKIIGMFDLTGLYLGGKVRVIETDHEKMEPSHRQIANQIIGEIPN